MRLRYHARYPRALCEGLAELREDVRPAAWRLEPVRTVDGEGYALDVTLVDAAGAVGVVGGIALDRVALADRGRSPFLAPSESAVVARHLERAYALIEAPLAELFATRGEPGKALHVFAGVDEGMMGERRRAGALGAAPYASLARARGGDVADGAYLETCVAGTVPPGSSGGVPRAFGNPEAGARAYVALSDAALAAQDGAFRAALDVAEALAGDELRVEVAGYDGRPLEGYAFVHVLGLDDPHAAAALLHAARARGARTLLTPRFDDPANGGFWGARAHARVLRITADEELLAAFLDALAGRHLVLDDGVRPGTAWDPVPGYRDAERAALQIADVVFVASAAEAQRIRALGVERAFAAIVPLAPAVAPPEPDAAPYVLAVGPVGPLSASATIARAAARAELPVRFAGEIVDGAYAARARAYLDDRSALAPGDPGAGARVAVDVSWTGADLGRLAAYAVHGVPVVASSFCDVREVLGTNGVWSADPAVEVALARTLREAWDARVHGDPALTSLAAHVAARCRADVLRACLRAGYLAAEPVA
ncbi:MAG: hypothetical protein JWO85_874 [Candidatus Eremiobacteraeota bacterium]|nr:hypothetical protein [Candidatus Eremiobacteraeota bacterium]